MIDLSEATLELRGYLSAMADNMRLIADTTTNARSKETLSAFAKDASTAVEMALEIERELGKGGK